ncbi:ribonuclease catalytic domain-containing protein [Piscinibacter koreensis]|uniref:RNB domain-containing ribonuclease n=1 Tax=Piscinibacter koreensis TaxID=2742824 RepID=A0A7Y6NM82_9BURK|nr:RNB domain-containing ribonuclease [Schlegelella koreensis]NUZ05711.1 RNB domain-containing ribonuclease [Schlegelella koreensis]
MYALYEDSGKFHAGRVMSESDASLQVELESGKRAKVKAANVLLKFDKPEPGALIAEAQSLAKEMDLDLAWEFAPEGEFGFADLARDYFGESAGIESKAAALFGLFDAPHYFRRLGKGNFKKAPEEIVKAALLGIERKRQAALQIDAWAGELVAGNCPPPIREQLYKILFKPDKNGPEYKAVVEASRQAQRAPLDILKDAGAIDSPYQFHWRRFLFEHFPKGTGFAAVGVPGVDGELPLAPVEAFSIDDSTTTEIDDALSVQGIGSGRFTLGIHIAAPGLALAPGTPVDAIARERLSTVYMPGHKITMLPPAVVDAYTLLEGRECPVVSLYVTFDEATLAQSASETRLERIRIAANLRHDQLDSVITEETLSGTATPVAPRSDRSSDEEPAVDFEAGASPAAADAHPYRAELTTLYRLARHLKAGREAVRGKPELFNRPDYAFRLEGNDDAEPRGDERVAIAVRRRGSPLDLIVAESMILANSTWGGWLAACGVPGIYRSQASLAPGNKVRMSTRPAPHAGMGVAQYAWSTSPLRRYVDLVNQWQLIACARHGRTAALAAPFKPKDVQLLAIIADFDATYSDYNAFQSGLERYWTLKYLEQNDVRQLDGVVMKDGLVRADTLPLVFRAIGAESLARGAHVRVAIGGTDLLTLDVHASVVGRIDDAPVPDDAIADDADDAVEGAGPIAIAIDLGEASDDASPDAREASRGASIGDSAGAASSAAASPQVPA